jgi:malonyl-CoA/methylmalonyl-CoA synthetase
MMLFTSGTTSLPKGVLHTHGSLGAIVESLRTAWSWSSDDHILHTLPMHHMHGVANIAACAQASGATLRWRPNGFSVQSAWEDLLHCDDLNVFMGVPTMYARMLSGMDKLSDSERRQVGDLGQKFRLMVAGSAALPATVATAWREATGVPLVERYGMTEVGMALSNGTSTDQMAFGTVGSPLPGVECAIVPMEPDADDVEAGGSATAASDSGELWVRGPMLFAGYWDRPEANADEFVGEAEAEKRGVRVLEPARDCHAGATGGLRRLEGFGGGNGNPWFRTGDIAQVDDQSFWKILGRASVDIIKSGGFKVSALEVETAVLDHPAVEEVAVLGMPDEGDMGEVITAVVVLKPGQALDTGSLRSFCNKALAKYKQPRDLIVLEAFERNAMGKINKKMLRKSLVESRA